VPGKKLGFIGLGIMGRPMCRNLIDAGYRVCVWNRSQRGIDECARHGAVAETSARAVAEKSEIVITMVTGSSDVSEVVLGSNGVLEGARRGMILTMSPRVTKEIARELKTKGVRMLDAPVSGGDRGARQGTLSIMVGGPVEVFQQCVPILEVLGSNIIHIGEENGVGQSTKLCNQVVGALNVLAVCEGFTLAAKSKLDMEKMFSAVKAGAAGSWQLNDLGPKILGRDWEPSFMVKTAQKDLRLVMEVAGDLGVCLPGVALVHQLHHAAEAEGLGEKGTQALIRALEKLANVEVRK
jgi:3-hydroxyisobutyrate dehydrogenase-like beta-hydroxyacid dehydrogenase